MKRIGFASTAGAGKDRWTEIAIFVQPDGGYVVEMSGVSSRQGETTRTRSVICPSPQDVVLTLAQFSRPAEAALVQAAQADNALQPLVNSIWE